VEALEPRFSHSWLPHGRQEARAVSILSVVSGVKVSRSLEKGQATANGDITTVESEMGEEPVLVEQLAA
jgi:hypothetical protein